MKKFSITVLLLLLAGMYSLAAQNATQDAKAQAAKAKPKTFTVKITPSIEARGTLNLDGAQEKIGATVNTSLDAKGSIKSELNYNDIVGGVLEIESSLGAGLGLGGIAPSINLGDNAYGYIHLLEAFGLMDKSILDIYLKGGRFEVDFDNAESVGVFDDEEENGINDWVADVGVLERDQRINMQADFKILDMITVRAGMSFAPFDDATYGNDLGLGVLFEKAFGDHKIIASAAYVLNSTDNTKKYGGDLPVNVSGLGTGFTDLLGSLGLTTGNGSTLLVPSTGNNTETSATNYDDLGFSVAYEGTFGQIVLMPFGNFRIRGLINKPKHVAYQNGDVDWSAGVKFSFKDATKSYDMVGAGLDMGGTILRTNANYYDQNGTLIEQAYTGPDKTFAGFGIKLWSDVLKSLMGDTYLSIWSTIRFDVWDLSSRDSIFKKFEIGLEQYVFHKKNANASIFAEMTIENVDPRNDASDVNVSLDLGLKVAFTGILTTSFE